MLVTELLLGLDHADGMPIAVDIVVRIDAQAQLCVIPAVFRTVTAGVTVRHANLSIDAEARPLEILDGQVIGQVCILIIDVTGVIEL